MSRWRRALDAAGAAIGQHVRVLAALALLLGVPGAGIAGAIAGGGLLGQLIGSDAFAGAVFFGFPIGLFVGACVYPRHVKPAVYRACDVLTYWPQEPPPPRA